MVSRAGQSGLVAHLYHQPRGAAITNRSYGAFPENTIRSFPSNTVGAALLARERLLIEKIRFMGEAWHRHRLTIELELGDVRRRLEHLASPTRRRAEGRPVARSSAALALTEADKHLTFAL